MRELEFARRIAAAAGENARAIRSRGITAETKPDASPVTIADKDNERLIREAVEREFPDDGILGEEGSSKPGTSGRRWIIDPIDGTRDFVRGNRFWCVLVALEEADEPVVGVAHFPMLDETYWAARGGGAFLNGERLQVSRVAKIEDAAFLPAGLHQAAARPHLRRVEDLTQRSWAVRSYGGALDACMVAAGKAEIWFEPKVEPWDLAALKLIIEEAGGVFFALDGSRRIDRGTAVGCAPGVADEVRKALGIGTPAGELSGFPIAIEIPVIWGDEDSFAHVNNVTYLRWCEAVRAEYLHAIGFMPEGEPTGIGPIIASITCHYRKPLNYPDTVTVAARVVAIGNSSFRIEQRIVSRATGEIAAEAEAVLVALDYSAGKTVPVPAAVREAIARLERRSF
jgi:histidinol-phosphatase